MALTEQIVRYWPQSSCYRQILTAFLFIFLCEIEEKKNVINCYELYVQTVIGSHTKSSASSKFSFKDTNT